VFDWALSKKDGCEDSFFIQLRPIAPERCAKCRPRAKYPETVHTDQDGVPSFKPSCDLGSVNLTLVCCCIFTISDCRGCRCRTSISRYRRCNKWVKFSDLNNQIGYTRMEDTSQNWDWILVSLSREILRSLDTTTFWYTSKNGIFNPNNIVMCGYISFHGSQNTASSMPIFALHYATSKFKHYRFHAAHHFRLHKAGVCSDTRPFLLSHFTEQP
jgi:hypothetical protein